MSTNQVRTTGTNEGKAIALNNEKGMLSFATQFVRDQKLVLPANYDVAGAVNGLYLQLLDVKDKAGKSALEVVTPHSLKKAVMDMVSKGLDPRKKQCYPIVYGDSLNLQVGYFGNQRLAQTFNEELSDFHAQVIYKGDEYETKIELNGSKTLVKHTQPFGDRSLDNMIGAYSVVQIGTDASGNPIYDLEDMTISQIKVAWAQSRSGGDVHKKFSEEMAKKTVINRHAKRFINTSDDGDVMKTSVTVSNPTVTAQEPINIDYVDADYVTDNNQKVNKVTGEIVDIADEDIPDFTKTSETFDDDYEFDEAEQNDVLGGVDENAEEDVLTVKYGAWTNEYKPTGEWEQVKGTYSATDKTVQIRRV